MVLNYRHHCYKERKCSCAIPSFSRQLILPLEWLIKIKVLHRFSCWFFASVAMLSSEQSLKVADILVLPLKPTPPVRSVLFHHVNNKLTTCRWKTWSGLSIIRKPVKTFALMPWIGFARWWRAKSFWSKKFRIIFQPLSARMCWLPRKSVT